MNSPKTEHHAGKEGRWVPIFPELRTELDRLFYRQPEQTEYVINRYRDPERTNLGTQFARITKIAGIMPIQRPFDNMRASRSTEVYEEHGAFLESKWIGHSSKIAHRHYFQVREVDFERAISGSNSVLEKAIGKGNIFPTSKRDFPTSSRTASDLFFDPQGVAIDSKESQQETTKALQTS